MTIGVDVKHDVTSSSTGQKSIAGFVASTSMGKNHLKVHYTGSFYPFYRYRGRLTYPYFLSMDSESCKGPGGPGNNTSKDTGATAYFCISLNKSKYYFKKFSADFIN